MCNSICAHIINIGYDLSESKLGVCYGFAFDTENHDQNLTAERCFRIQIHTRLKGIYEETCVDVSTVRPYKEMLTRYEQEG